MAGVVAMIIAGCNDGNGTDPEPPPADPTATEGEPGTGPEDTEPAPTDNGDGGGGEPGNGETEPAPPQTVELYGPDGWDGASGRGVQLEIPGDWTVLDLGEVVPGGTPAATDDLDAAGSDAADSGAEADGSETDISDVSAQGSRADAAADDVLTPDGQPAWHWCLVPAQEYPALEGCAGLSVAVGGDWLPGQYGLPYAANQAEGWRPTAEPIRCPIAEEADEEAPDEGEPTDVVEPVPGESGPLTSDETRIGEHLMRYETWRVTCTESEETFTPRVWQSRSLNVLVRDYVGIPETVPILISIEALEVLTGTGPDGTEDAPEGDTATETEGSE